MADQTDVLITANAPCTPTENDENDFVANVTRIRHPRSPKSNTSRTHLDCKSMDTVEISSQEAAIDSDFLDVIVMAEDGFHDSGFKEGFALGERAGFQQGRETGHVKGREVGSEIGFYLGFATMWKALLEKQTGNKPKVVKALESLLSLLQKFPVGNPSYEGLWEDLKMIRSKFKQVASLLNVTIDDSGGTKVAMSF